MQLKRAKEEMVLEVEKKMTIIRLQMKEMAMRCEVAEERKTQVSLTMRSDLPLSLSSSVECVHVNNNYSNFSAENEYYEVTCMHHPLPPVLTPLCLCHCSVCS